MTYYAFIKDNKIDGIGQCKCISEGFKNLEITQEQFENIDKYIYQYGILIPDPNYYKKQVEKLRQEKYLENEKIRDNFLISGVLYKEVLFDSDLEQKLNINFQVNAMSEEDTVVWVGKDGITSLECTREDLYNIGMLLVKMTTYVWQYRNPEIKLAIQNATTIEELNEIEIKYSLDEMINCE